MRKFYDILDWDSHFFQFNVANILELPQSEQEISAFLNDMKRDKVELLYYASKENLSFPPSITNHLEIHQVDLKTTYEKPLEAFAIDNKHIRSFSGDYPNEKLFSLAIESGFYSRFNIDPNIPTEKFKDLYRFWIINAVNKKIAKEVLVYYVEETIAGFITLREQNQNASIGIIAVDANFRGRGIAKALISAAENWFIQDGYDTIQVVTQAANKPACALYERCGYELAGVEYYYHMWISH